MTDLDKIRERIRQLRKMTVENGCTEAEALSAAEMALKLMAEYGLQDIEVENAFGSQNTYGRRRTVADELWKTVAFVCGVRAFYRQSDRLLFVYYGRADNVMVAEYLHELLIGALRRSCREFRSNPEYLRRRKAKTRNAAMKAFQQAMVGRLRARLQTLWWRRADESGNGYKFLDDWNERIALLDDSLAAEGVRLGGRMRNLRLPDRRFDGARVEGAVAGNNVAIEPGVTSGATMGLIGGGR